MTNITELKEKLIEDLGVSIGTASMCWSEVPKGVFDSTRASEIVDTHAKTITALLSIIEEMQDSLRDISILNNLGEYEAIRGPRIAKDTLTATEQKLKNLTEEK